MIQEVIARRYAKALATAALEKNELAQTRIDVERLIDILDPGVGEISVPEFADFLLTPTVKISDKLLMTDKLCEKLQIGKLVSDFLNVLIKHRRTQLASRILKHYVLIASGLEKIDEAFVESAAALSAAQQQTLTAALEKKLNNKVRLFCTVNPSLVAGLRIKIGDLLLENSVRGRLERLERALA